MIDSNSKKAESEADLDNALAILISCTHNKARPMSLTEIAKWVEIAVGHLGSFSAVASRIGLSSKMLRQFTSVRRLTPMVQALFQSRKLDSVDAATYLSMLPKNEQEVAAKALVAEKINTIDLRAVVELYKLGSDASISSLMQKVAKSKVKKEYVVEFVLRGSLNRNKLLTSFKRHLPASEIVALEINGALGRLIITSKGRQALANAARRLHTPLKQLIPIILQPYSL